MIPELEMEPIVLSSDSPDSKDSKADDRKSNLGHGNVRRPLTTPVTTTSTSSTSTSVSTSTSTTAPPTPPRAAIVNTPASQSTTSSSIPARPILQQDNNSNFPTTNSSSLPSSTSSSNALIHSDGNGRYTIGHNGPTLTTADIVGICAGAAAILIIILGFFIWCCCRRSSKRNKVKGQGQRRLQLESAAGPGHSSPRTSLQSKLSSKSQIGTFKSKRKQKKQAAAMAERAEGGQVDEQSMLEKRQLVFGRKDHQGYYPNSNNDFQRLSSDEGHDRQAIHPSKTDDGDYDFQSRQEHDPTMQTFANYFESRGTEPLPSNYRPMDPFQDQDQNQSVTSQVLPYYKNGRLSTGMGLTPANNETMVPPLMPIAPPRAAAATQPSTGFPQVKQARKAKLANGGQPVPYSRYQPCKSPLEASVIHFDQADDQGDTVAPLQSTIRGGQYSTNNPPQTMAPTRDRTRDTMASLYSMESAQENHDYGNSNAHLPPPMPAMRRYI